MAFLLVVGVPTCTKTPCFLRRIAGFDEQSPPKGAGNIEGNSGIASDFYLRELYEHKTLFYNVNIAFHAIVTRARLKLCQTNLRHITQKVLKTMSHAIQVDQIILRPGLINPNHTMVVCLKEGNEAQGLMKLSLANPRQVNAIKTIIQDFNASQLETLVGLTEALHRQDRDQTELHGETLAAKRDNEDIFSAIKTLTSISPKHGEATHTISTEFNMLQLDALNDLAGILLQKRENGESIVFEDRTPPQGRPGGRGASHS